MNKISKLALALFVINAVTNISFGMNPQKEPNSEQILQEKLRLLKKEKEKEEASWFNKIYRPYKCFGDEPHFTDIMLTRALMQQFVNNLLFPLVTYFIPVTKDNKNSFRTSMAFVNGLLQIARWNSCTKTQNSHNSP